MFKNTGCFPFSLIGPHISPILTINIQNQQKALQLQQSSEQTKTGSTSQSSLLPPILSIQECGRIILRASHIIITSHPPPPVLMETCRALFTLSKSAINDLLFHEEKLLIPLLSILNMPAPSRFEVFVYVVGILKNVTASAETNQVFLVHSGAIDTICTLFQQVINPYYYATQSKKEIIIDDGTELQKQMSAGMKESLAKNPDMFINFLIQVTAFLRNICGSIDTPLPSSQSEVLLSDSNQSSYSPPRLNISGSSSSSQQKLQTSPSYSNGDRSQQQNATNDGFNKQDKRFLLLSIFLHSLLKQSDDEEVIFNISRILSKISLIPECLSLLQSEENEYFGFVIEMNNERDEKNEEKDKLEAVNRSLRKKDTEKPQQIQKTSKQQQIHDEKDEKMKPKRIHQNCIMQILRKAATITGRGEQSSGSEIRHSSPRGERNTVIKSSSSSQLPSYVHGATLVRILFAVSNMNGQINQYTTTDAYRRSWGECGIIPVLSKLLLNAWDKIVVLGPNGNTNTSSSTTNKLSTPPHIVGQTTKQILPRPSSPSRPTSGGKKKSQGSMVGSNSQNILPSSTIVLSAYDELTKCVSAIANLCVEPQNRIELFSYNKSNKVDKQKDGQPGDIVKCIIDMLESLAENYRSAMSSSATHNTLENTLTATLNKSSSQNNLSNNYTGSGLTLEEEELLLNTVGMLANISNEITVAHESELASIDHSQCLCVRAVRVLCDTLSYHSNQEMISESARAMGSLTRLPCVRKFMLEKKAYELYAVLLGHSDPQVLAPVVGGLLNLAEDTTIADALMTWQGVKSKGLDANDEEEADDESVIMRLLRIITDFGLMDLTLSTFVCRCLVNIRSNATVQPQTLHILRSSEVLGTLYDVAQQYESDPPSLMDDLIEAADRAKELITGESMNDLVPF
ncbi:MAG: hypothetical protein EZS28_005568 [Streblomastix strix]|uniref:Uncharacterized protein n=1 Tax=Streblomastix strix TaxID=222440 RepID=A0A5J4WVH1_9EUKA|nr:MAG: hypothetical protein EZS28_005568 [Streblomastix strix]